MFIFTIGDAVLGICDDEHLKKSVSKIWKESVKNGISDDVIIHEIKQNTIEYEPTHPTYYFDKYDEGTKLGLRLIGLGGSIDIPLEIEV